MRKAFFAVPVVVLALSPLVSLAACGPSKPTPKTPDLVEGDEGPGFGARKDAAAGAIAPADAGPGTTTTATLGDDDGGTRLAPLTTATTSASASASSPTATASSSGASATGCDPGRCVPDIYAEVQSRRPLARACYDAALKAHPGVEGKLVIAFEIDPKGVVTKTGIKAEETEPGMNDAGLASCIGDIITKIKFPESPRGRLTKANYRFEFHPRGR